MSSEKPNPGSSEAVAKGCKCPVIDNAHGRGYMGNPEVFVLQGNCPLHGEGTDYAKPFQETHP